MDTANEHYLVPKHEEGFKKDILSTYDAETVDEAQDIFVDGKERLLDVNNWSEYCPELDTEFAVTDSKGKELMRRAHKSDYFRIGRPGATYNWMHIEAIEYDDYPDIDVETIAMRMCAAGDPHTAGGVLNKESTNIFVIERRHKKMVSIYHGRHETTNTDTWFGMSDELMGKLLACLIE